MINLDSNSDRDAWVDSCWEPAVSFMEWPTVMLDVKLETKLRVTEVSFLIEIDFRIGTAMASVLLHSAWIYQSLMFTY